MKIAVNTRLLLKGRLAGIGNTTHEILRRMVKAHPEQDFLFLFDRPYAPEFIYADNVVPLTIFPQARHPFLFYWWFEWQLPRILKKHQVDLFLSPDNFLSLRSQVPSLLILHDLAFEHYPNDLPFWHRKHYRYFVPQFAKKANKIATVSEASKQDICQQYGVPADKIEVIHVGLNENIAHHASLVQQADLKQKYAKGKAYFIHVGTIQPRKNYVNLLKAFDAFKKRTGAAVQLLLIGRKGWKTSAIYKTHQAMEHAKAVHFLHRISNRELSILLSGALGLLCVSYFEGFGMPVIEAQCCRCPVIASKLSSIPEVAGTAALFVDPFSVEAIQIAMTQLYKDPALRQQLIADGFENAKRFSWNKTSQKLWGMAESILKMV